MGTKCKIRVMEVDEDTGIEVPLLLEDEVPEMFDGFMLLGTHGKGGLNLVTHMSVKDMSELLVNGSDGCLDFLDKSVQMAKLLKDISKRIQRLNERTDDDAAE